MQAMTASPTAGLVVAWPENRIGSPNVTDSTENGSRDWSRMTSSEVDTYIVESLGPQRLALTWLVPLTTIYFIIFLTGIIGNTCTCLVILRNHYMQTATNLYLCNLAIADMLTLICAMPLELYTLWQQYPWQLGNVVCELRAIVPEATAYASILTIVTFSTERYIAICYPIRQQTKSKFSRAIRNIVVIWMLSVVGATPYGIFTRVNYLTDARKVPIQRSAWCGFPFNDPDHSWETLMLCSTFLFFVVPMTIIIVLYIRIAVALHQSNTLQRGASERGDGERSKVQSRRVVIRMLIAVVIAFFVCWAPFHAQRLLFLYVSLYGTWTQTLRKVNQDIFSLAGCFYYLNSTINPILYSVMSNRFRVAFREKLCTGPPSVWCICCCCWCCCTKRRNAEKRVPRTVIYRNSHSQSSSRSFASYQMNNAARIRQNDSCSRLRSLDPTAESLPTTVTWVKNPQYVAVNIPDGGGSGSIRRNGAVAGAGGISPLSTKCSPVSTLERKSPTKLSPTGTDGPAENISVEEEERTELDEELEQALKPQLQKLADGEAGCVSCANCNILFTARPSRSYSPVEKSASNSEVTQLDMSFKCNEVALESNV